MLSKALQMYKTLGVLFLALVVLSVYLTYAVFTKKFTDYDRVTLETSSIGLQLPSRADIKIRGVIVGEVLDTDATGDGATITLGIFSDMIDVVPADVTGSIIPKTLFGEKYVSLIIPDGPSPAERKKIKPIAAGAVITKTRVSTEVEEVLSDLLPLLREVQPGELNMALNAIATALEGRGDQLGNNLETVDSYLKRLNPKIPALVEDLRLTTKVSDIYSDVLPQLGDVLDNTIKTGNTIETKEAKLSQLFNDIAGLSDTTRTFLADNGDNIVRVGRLGVQQFRVLARYSSEFPCLLGGLTNIQPRLSDAFRGFVLHIDLETLPNQPRPYTPADAPRLGDDRAPHCGELPLPSYTQANPYRDIPDFNDGVDEPTGKGTQRAPTGYLYRDGTGYAGSTAETDLYRKLLAPGVGDTPDQVGDLGPLLVAPIARGAEVTLR